MFETEHTKFLWIKYLTHFLSYLIEKPFKIKILYISSALFFCFLISLKLFLYFDVEIFDRFGENGFSQKSKYLEN